MAGGSQQRLLDDTVEQLGINGIRASLCYVFRVVRVPYQFPRAS